MKRKNILYWAAVSVLGGSLIISQVNADTGSTPGSNEDPVVSKSYVDEAIRAALGSGAGNATSGGLELLTLSKGQTVIGVNGTEIIVRGGQATAIAGPSGGLSDVTVGVDIKQDQVVPANHHIIVPKADGRGITAKVDNTYVLVRGGYSIK